MRRWILNGMMYTLVLIVCLELFFRYVIPASSNPVSVQSASTRIIRLGADQPREGYMSEDRFASERYHWTVNDQGYNSSFDYRSHEERDRPLIALIGDSGIEGYRSNVEEHIGVFLMNELGGRSDVYSFGRAAQGLLQSLMILEEVDSLYRPDICCFLSTGSNLTWSLEGQEDQYYLNSRMQIVYSPPTATRTQVRPLRTFIPLVLKQPYVFESITGRWDPTFAYILSFQPRPPIRFQRAPMVELLLQSATLRYLNFNAQQKFITSLILDACFPEQTIAAVHDAHIVDVRPFAAEYICNILETSYPEMSFIFIRDDFRLRGQLQGMATTTDPNEDADNYELFLQCEKRKNFYFLNLADVYSALDVNERDYFAQDLIHLNSFGNHVVAQRVAYLINEYGLISEL